MKLLPCPFCGLNLDDEDPHSYLSYSPTCGIYQLSCLEEAQGCTASVIGRSEEEVITRWNTRVVKH